MSPVAKKDAAHFGLGNLAGGIYFSTMAEAERKRHEPLKLLRPRRLHPAAILPADSGVDQTRHPIRNRNFLIYHLFLPI